MSFPHSLSTFISKIHQYRLSSLSWKTQETDKYYGVIWFGVKTALLGSAVYYTIDKGVWKDSATTTALYEELEQGLSPYVGEIKNQVPYELPPLPSNDRISYLFKHYWNSGVKSTFRFLIDLPTHTNEVVDKAYGMMFSTLEAEDQSLNNASKEVGSK